MCSENLLAVFTDLLIIFPILEQMIYSVYSMDSNESSIGQNFLFYHAKTEQNSFIIARYFFIERFPLIADFLVNDTPDCRVQLQYFFCYGAKSIDCS